MRSPHRPKSLPQAVKTVVKNPPSPRAVNHEDDKDAIASYRKRIAQTYRPDRHKAVFAIVQHIADNASDAARMLEAEKQLFAQLLRGGNSRNLRRVFALNDRLKKQARGMCDIKHVHVIGAGVMGGDIAAVTALTGFTVSLQDVNSEAIDAACKRAEDLFTRKLKKPDAVTEALARLIPDPDGAQLPAAELIIEAVAESLPIKQQLFQAAAARAKPEAIFASNTSAIPLEQIAETLPQPERLLGLHFFNPVPVLPLVEIIRTAKTAQSDIDRVLAFVGRLKKLPVLCQSAPGFLVNHALFPYIFAALEAVLAGENPDKIDQALTDFGMPMGPIELADQVGLDICLQIGEILGGAEIVMTALKEKIAAGLIGRKSGEGFYLWQDKKAERPRSDYPQNEMNAIAKQMLAPLIQACRQAVADGVVADADIADAAMLFGVGFPPHTGGPLNS